MTNFTNDDAVTGGPCGVYNAKVDPTAFSTLGRPLDRGDVLPFDWTLPEGQSREDLLRRLSPDASGDFRAASYLKDWVDMGSLADCRLS